MTTLSLSLKPVSTIKSISAKTLLSYALLLLVGTFILSFRLNTYPAVWFDEGYKLNAVRTLSETTVYGTYTVKGYIPFDPGISSGPVDLIPIAVVFRLFGAGVLQARLVSIVFTLIAILAFYHLTRLLQGERAALPITCIAIAVPALGSTGFLLIGRQILGEPAALACTLVGLWLWFRSWKTGQWWLTIAAGVVIGLGMLSKTQVAIALFPAVLATAFFRWLKYRQHFLKLMTPPFLILAIFGLWMLIGALNTPADIRQENSILLMAAIQTNLLTPLPGREVQNAFWIIVSIMGVAASASFASAFRGAKSERLNAVEQWSELSIGLFLTSYIVWFAFLSIGWPRYAYVGLIVALIPIGKLFWNIARFVSHRLELNPQRAYPAFIGGLCLLAIATNLYPAFKTDASNGVQQVADYIDANIPIDAVIETWEWEIDALSDHWQFHHPNQRYLFQAIRQFAYEQGVFDLDYNILEADPDYLITGGFSTWTGLYPAADIEANFTPLTTFGPYTIYERKNKILS